MSQDNEIPSEVIKLVILRLLKNRPHVSQYKWNLLRAAYGKCDVEKALGITFDDATAYRASVCFDELRMDGYIVPQRSNFNSNPEDWVTITKKGLRAIEAGKLEAPVAGVADTSSFGIPNLTAFNRLIAELKDTEMISCLFMDLDNFKAVNDQFNHDVGDEVIKRTLEITELTVRGRGTVFHRSGDEILVLLPNFDRHEACAVAERIRNTIEKYKFPTIGVGFVTTTIGVSTSSSTCKPDQLAVSADTAAMQAKRQGKNQVVHAGSIEHTSS